MSKFMEYKGYLGTVDVDSDGGFLYGKLAFIQDVVSYRADDVKRLVRAFHEAVDDYLATCAELGDVPDVPCKGTFNVRVGPSLHQKIAVDATRQDISLNDWIKQACELKLAADGGEIALTATARGGVIQATFVDVQAFDFGGTEDWQTQNNRPLH